MRSYEVGVQFFLKTQPVFPALSTPLKSLQALAAAPTSLHDPSSLQHTIRCPASLTWFLHGMTAHFSRSITKVPESVTAPSSTGPKSKQSLVPSLASPDSLCHSSIPQGNALGMGTSLLHPHTHHPAWHLVRSMFPNHSAELHLATHWSWPSDHHNTWRRPSFFPLPAPSLYLVQPQGLPIFGPGDKQQWGISTDWTLDHPSHANGQGCLRRHDCHLCWV